MKYLKNTFRITIENEVCIFIIILKLKSNVNSLSKNVKSF